MLETEHTLRQIALQQAAHDFRGDADSHDVVSRACVYLDFLLTGQRPKEYPAK